MRMPFGQVFVKELLLETRQGNLADPCLKAVLSNGIFDIACEGNLVPPLLDAVLVLLKVSSEAGRHSLDLRLSEGPLDQLECLVVVKGCLMSASAALKVSDRFISEPS